MGFPIGKKERGPSKKTSAFSKRGPEDTTITSKSLKGKGGEKQVKEREFLAGTNSSQRGGGKRGGKKASH